MGIIAIEGIEIFAYHGVYPVEREAGNRFFVDLYLEADLENAAKSDALSDTVDYHAVYKVVLEHMEEPANLLETLAYRIGPDILARFQQIVAATVRVRKLSPHAMAHCRETYVEQKFHQKGDKTEKSGN